MEKTLLTRKNFHKCTEIKDRNNLSVIYRSNFRNCTDSFNPRKSLVKRVLVCREDINDTLASLSILSDGNCSTCLLLNLLDSLATLSDNSTDEV